MKDIMIKQKLTQMLKGYICVNEEILEDLPELAQNDGVIKFCSDEGCDIIHEAIEFCGESEEEFNLEKEIERAFLLLIEEYDLVKEVDKV